MPQPLPNNPFSDGMPAHQAYATCLMLEDSFPPTNWLDPPTGVCARLMGYLLIHVPMDGGIRTVAIEINFYNIDMETPYASQVSHKPLHSCL